MKIYSTISDDYAFDHPGNYTIRIWGPATKGSPGKPELNRIYSNTIKITVLSAGDPAGGPPSE